MAEERQDFERAVSEYEKLRIPMLQNGKQVLARISAARLCLKRLNRPQDALTLYQTASASAVPHLDLEQDIVSGIREAREWAVAE